MRRACRGLMDENASQRAAIIALTHQAKAREIERARLQLTIDRAEEKLSQLEAEIAAMRARENKVRGWMRACQARLEEARAACEDRERLAELVGKLTSQLNVTTRALAKARATPAIARGEGSEQVKKMLPAAVRRHLHAHNENNDDDE